MGLKRLAVAPMLVIVMASLLLSALAIWSEVEALTSRDRVIALLKGQVQTLDKAGARQPDWSAVARSAAPSVSTLVTAGSLGSAWTVRSSATGSDLVTNFHVIADAWNAGDAAVQVRHGDQSVSGTITAVDRNEDLALVHVGDRWPALGTAFDRLQLGDPVMVVGSPLGLGGTVSVGIVSRFSSVDGSDYLQFTAAISPGNSGGPVLDRQGRVVAVAARKFEAAGVEGLALGIPVQMVCVALIRCRGSS